MKLSRLSQRFEAESMLRCLEVMFKYPNFLTPADVQLHHGGER